MVKCLLNGKRSMQYKPTQYIEDCCAAISRTDMCNKLLCRKSWECWNEYCKYSVNLNLPYTSHCYLLPLLTKTLPIFVETSRRSARFILNCFNNGSSLVQTVVRHGIHFACYNSCVGHNLLFCCDFFKWQLNEFVEGRVPLNYFSFSNFCNDKLSDFEICYVSSLSEAGLAWLNQLD